MIAGINESKTLKYMSCECKCKSDCRKYDLNQQQNKDKYQCECKNLKEHQCAKKIIFGILLHVVGKMVNIQQVVLTIH